MSSNAKKVLIVDDEEELLDVLKTSLQHAGFEVQMAQNGPTCLEVLKTFKADVILLDLIMPDMDGWEVCQRLRQNPKTQNIPVVIFSAAQPKDLQVKLQEARAVRFVTKPHNPEELIKYLRESVTC